MEVNLTPEQREYVDAYNILLNSLSDIQERILALKEEADISIEELKVLRLKKQSNVSLYNIKITQR